MVPAELFIPPGRITSRADMKTSLTSRTDLRWLGIAVPTLFVAHWLLVTMGPRLVQFLPYTLRAVMHLL